MGDGSDLPLVGPPCNTPTPQQDNWEQFEPADGVQSVFPMEVDDNSNHEVGEQPTFLQTFPDARPPLLASPFSVGEHSSLTSNPTSAVAEACGNAATTAEATEELPVGLLLSHPTFTSSPSTTGIHCPSDHDD